MTTLAEEAVRRRTSAVTTHPDADKSVPIETLAPHAYVINEANAVHGKADHKSTVSGWMDMEKDCGISTVSSALQFEYQPEGHNGKPHMVNPVDTSGHADLSEDTYRVFTTADVAVMLVDGTKGLESRTLKLFWVCKSNGILIVTVTNKRNYSGKAPLELMDEIIAETSLQPTPLCWLVGEAGDLRGLLERGEDGEAKQFIGFERIAGGAIIVVEYHPTPDEAVAEQGDAWETAAEESELLSADSAGYDQEMHIADNISPVIFASATPNWGVHQILDTLCELVPAPGARESDPAVAAATTAGGQGAIVEKREPMDDSSGVVFEAQAGMDTYHRDKLVLIRVVSGGFDRDMQVTHAQSGHSFSTKYALTVFGRTRSAVETAYPGDTAGLVNAGSLALGDTIYEGRKVQFKPISQFVPEHSRTLRAKSLDKYKQFRKAVDQFDAEGVVQILRNDARGDAAPVMAAVDPMQFEVMMVRMENEYNVEAIAEPIPYSVACRMDEGTASEPAKQCGVEIFTRSDGILIAPLGDKWKLPFIEKEHPEFTLETLAAN